MIRYRIRAKVHQYAMTLSHATRWSTLAKVGSTPAMRLTIMVPVIGLLLLFNQAAEQALAWPTFFLRDLHLSPSTDLPSENLYFTYFGLCFLGFGSLLYAAFCPREISDQPNIGRYVIETPAAGSSVIAKDDFRDVLRHRFARELSERGSDTERLDYPSSLEGDFEGLMAELYGAVEFDGDIDGMPDVMLPSGYLDHTELARSVWHNIRPNWVFTLPFYDVAPQFARDIAFLKFKSLDYSVFLVRVSLAFIYACGFALVLKPTLHVFLLLLAAWLR